MVKDNFFKDSLILTASNLATGILGFMFSIILSRELGAEGMGLYGLIMPIYNLFICLISGGMVAAVSKVAAEYFTKNDFKNLNKTIKVCLSFDLIWGIIISILVFIFASFISTYVIKDVRALNAIKIICPAMVFVGLSSILKGYFYGVSNVKIPAVIDILEKAIRIAVVVALINFSLIQKSSNTVTAAYIALAVGEFVSMFLLYIYYKYNKRRNFQASGSSDGRAQLLFNILVISLPLCLNGFLSTALNTLSTLIVPRRLISAGIEYSTALSMIGKFNGMALNVTFFPMIVIGSMVTVLIPTLSQSVSRKDNYALEKRIAEVLKISFLLGICTLVICITIPDSLGRLFFGRPDLGSYIRFASLAAPLAYTAVTTYGILNGLGKQGILLRNSLIISVEEVLLLYILTSIPQINIFGYGLSLMITSFTAVIANLYEINKKYFIDFSLPELGIDLLLAVLLYYTLKILNNFIPDSIFILKNIIIITLGFALFFFSMAKINKNNT